MARPIKRTRKLLGSLRDNAASLFTGGVDVYGMKVTAFPNGRAGELWIKSGDGQLGFALSVSEGPAGLSVTVRAFAHKAPLTVGSDHPDDPSGYREQREVIACQYRTDARSQAFRRWYHKEETPADVALLGPEYARREG